MENKFVNFVKHFLSLHMIIFSITIAYLVFVRIIKNNFYMYDVRMPWQETFLNTPLKYLLRFQVILYWSKMFLILSGLVVFFYRLNIKRSFYIHLLLVCFIYLAIELNMVHNFFNALLNGYDANAPVLSGRNNKFF